MRYKIGDKVRIRKDLLIGCEYDNINFASTMARFRGKIVTIADTLGGGYEIQEDGRQHYWTDRMIKCKAERVIFKGNKTTLKTESGKEIISKCSENDKFDKEKGVLMCIAKKAGYEYQDIKNLVENSKTEKETITLTEFLESDKRMAIRCNTELEFYKVAFACNGKGRFKTYCDIFEIFKNKKYETKCIDNDRIAVQNFSNELFYKGIPTGVDYEIFDFNQVDLTK